MKRSKQESRERPAKRPACPSVLGTGLLALDVVVSEVSGEPPRSWAGGTCGNVLIALSYLGWQSRPVARLRSGAAADRILADLKHWGVSDQFISVAEDGSTPVIVERVTQGSGGTPRHSFSWRCPTCGSPFSGYKPVLAATAEEIAQGLASPQVFFFDRLSAGALILARASAEAGALVVFEPSGIGNPVQFRQAWEISHIVKYSHERLSELPEVGVEEGPLLQVETCGEGGLRFRRLLPGGRERAWVELDALPANKFKDAAGSGDWCTAGFLSRAAAGGSATFVKLQDRHLREAFRYGQALATWNCGYEGARGGMYAVDQQTFEEQVCSILQGKKEVMPVPPALGKGETNPLRSLCPACLPLDCEVPHKTNGRRPAREAR